MCVHPRFVVVVFLSSVSCLYLQSHTLLYANPIYVVHIRNNKECCICIICFIYCSSEDIPFKLDNISSYKDSKH